jgi:hypothetical protein
MNIKRAIGILLLIIGVFTIFYANYLKAEIAAAGADAYDKINRSSKLFQGNPVSEAFGGAMTGKLKKKTASEIARYNQMVQYLLIGGIVVAVVGGGMAIFCTKKQRKKK